MRAIYGKPAIARRVALDCLLRVEAGAYASERLIERTAGLDPRDAGLAAEITLGVLRRRGQLDALIEQHAKRPVAKLDAAVAMVLRMAIYQVRFLDRIPPYAAVNDSLNLLRAARKASAVSFANAVLRKVIANGAEPSDSAAVPEWLLAKWRKDFGDAAALGIAHASLEVPRTYQHVPPGADPPPDAIATDVPGCWEVQSPDARFRVQDIGSQAIVPLLDVQPNHGVLDVCAAPGNKTAQIREIAPHVVAADLSFQRLIGMTGIRVVADATQPLPFARAFDRVLVDAPCSGTGTLRHNPEIKWRVQPGDFASFATRQRAILTNALDVLKPDGLLVYSTCSLEPEENEHVVRAVCATRIVREIRRMPGRDEGDGFYAAVIR